MSEDLQNKIVEHLKSGQYRPTRARGLAGELNLKGEEAYPEFRRALKELMSQGKVVMGAKGTIVLPAPKQGRSGDIIGVYSQKKGGFGFVVPREPAGHEDLYIPRGEQGNAISGDVVRAKITSRDQRNGKSLFEGRVLEVIERKQKNFVGTLQKVSGEWLVYPDGNALTNAIATPDAASKHIKVGTKVVVELTTYPEDGEGAAGVIVEVLGKQGEKDVDLRSVIVQFNLPGDFPEAVKDEARAALEKFRKVESGSSEYLGSTSLTAGGSTSLTAGGSTSLTAGGSTSLTAGGSTSLTAGGSTSLTAGGSTSLTAGGSTSLTAGGSTSLTAGRAGVGRDRYDLSEEVICTIDPVDAKDYDDAISLRRNEEGLWELGVHIADVSFFVPEGSALDAEAKSRGNSTYFPGYVIPMLPEVLSNGVCSLQEGVARFCKSAFITYDENAKPIRSKFANTIIKSRNRLRYEEAQAIIDGAATVPHPDGNKIIADYPSEVVQLLKDMNQLARRIQKRRHGQGQIVLDLPEVDLVLDESGKVIDAVQEDTSFTHTLIEMFMVEANEAVARLLDSQNLPFLRRTHPGPDATDHDRLRQFVNVAGYKLPKTLDHKAIQALLATVKGKPGSFAINMMVLRSLSRAEYSPESVGHFALASEHYCHFTSPIRRYADLTIHRLLDAYFSAREAGQKKVDPGDVPSYEQLVDLGKQISYTERRSEEAERELRQVKVLELLQGHIGEDFAGVVTGITNFGIFVQIQKYLIDGLIRYEELMDDWWDVDERAGVVRGQRTGIRIGIGAVAKVRVAAVDLPRRELKLGIIEIAGKRPGQHTQSGARRGGGRASTRGPKHGGPKRGARRRRR